MQPAYVAWRAGMSNSIVVPARQAGNRFLGSLKGLQIRAQMVPYLRPNRRIFFEDQAFSPSYYLARQTNT
jgi:hypothetical protein